MSDITFGTLGVPAPLVAVLAATARRRPSRSRSTPCPTPSPGATCSAAARPAPARPSRSRSRWSRASAASSPAASRRAGRPLGLVLAPTRELATQIAAVLEPLAAAYGLKITTIFGGVSQNRQVAALSAGVDIVVACPGRLEDLMKPAARHASTRSRSPCSTRPTTWPTSASCPASPASSTRHPGRRTADAVLAPRSTTAWTSSSASSCRTR